MDLGREDRGDCEFDVDSASGLDSQRAERDHEKANLKDILLRKLQEKQQNKAEKSEVLDQLESWHKERSAAGFHVEILHLTSKALSSRRLRASNSVSCTRVVSFG